MEIASRDLTHIFSLKATFQVAHETKNIIFLRFLARSMALNFHDMVEGAENEKGQFFCHATLLFQAVYDSGWFLMLV
jgi:hypothetical protein